MPTNRANFTPPTVGTILDQTYELVDPGTLIEHPKNPNEGDVGEIMSSIATTGFFGALHVQTSTRHVCAGNHRLKAAIALGMPEVPVIWIDCDDETAMRVLVADNRIARLGHNNDDALAAILQEIAVTARGLEGTGYDGDDLDLLLADIEGSAIGGGPDVVGDPDDIPEPPTNPVTARGDVWLLGPHRIMCGDCRAPKDVAVLMAGTKATLGFTSPPYAAQRNYDETSGFVPIPPQEYVAWFQAVAENTAAHLTMDGSWIVNIKAHADDGERSLYVMELVCAHARDWGWRYVDEFVWPRPGFPIDPRTARRFKNAWEPVHHFALVADFKFNPNDVMVESSSSFTYDPNQAMSVSKDSGFVGVGRGDKVPGMAYPSNVLPGFGVAATGTDHSAAFPVKFPAWFIRACTDPEDVVYDPFVGSGSTILAAHGEGRIGFGMELSPTAVDQACERFQRVTGIVPIFEATKEPHDFTTSAT